MDQIFNLLLQLVLGPFYAIFSLFQGLFGGGGTTG